MLIRHKVKDYLKWKQFFDISLPVRKMSGEKSCRIFRNTDDPDDLTILFEWKDVDTALKKWRKAIESKGIYVFKEAFHLDDISGFCIYDYEFPVIYLNNSMPETAYPAISIVANDLSVDPPLPRSVALVRGNRRRFIVVHFPETVYTDNLKILPGHCRARRDTITEVEVYGPVGGPDTLANKGFPNDPRGTHMFMGVPSHVPPVLPPDLTGEYVEAPGLRQDLWIAPAVHAGITVSEDVMTLAQSIGRFGVMPVTEERRKKRDGMVNPVVKWWQTSQNRWATETMWRIGTVTPLTTPARYAWRPLAPYR